MEEGLFISQDRDEDSTWEVCCDPESADIATLFNKNNEVTMVLGDRDFITVSPCDDIDTCNGDHKWKVHAQHETLQLELQTGCGLKSIISYNL